MYANNDLTIIKTLDNSNTLFSKKFNEPYHSKNGAFTEAEHIFINAGLSNYKNKKNINVLEIGFGTGLNALATLNFASENNIAINYNAIEAYPLDILLIIELNYFEYYSKDLKQSFLKMHDLENTNTEIKLTPLFNFKLDNTSIEKYIPLNNYFDVIYFDAFAPESQPELWQEYIFKKMYEATNINGCLVTYCAKGVVKRILKSVGYTIFPLPGPPGKREITSAIKL